MTADGRVFSPLPYLTPAEKLTTGKKNPSVLKSSNIPWTGCPLILKDMLGAPRSRQQLTTSSEFSRCWLMEATALGIRPGWKHRGMTWTGVSKDTAHLGQEKTGAKMVKEF